LIPHHVRRRHSKKNSVWKMRGVFFAPSDFPPRPRAGIWKNRVAKNRVLMREGSPIFTSDFFSVGEPEAAGCKLFRDVARLAYQCVPLRPTPPGGVSGDMKN